jgi:tetratricopeptide (TPR) repeat protein
MSNIMPQTPSFVFGYWRPWKENSNLFDSYLDYVKDTSLVKYGADTVGQYILEASENQVIAINKLGEAIGLGMDVLSGQLREISSELTFLNKNVDILIEQNKLSNLLLQNIAELLRVPDSEKERQHSIELGIKFFVNARKDADLYQDALEQLCKAELLMKQDYFVLHRIGCIYLYVKEYINPEKALDYFIRAAKYASVESDPKAIRLINALADKSSNPNSQSNSDINKIKHLAAESYEKAAFAAYVLGKNDDAVHFQSKAFNLNSTAQNRFILSKYHIRNQNISSAVENLDKAIEELPELTLAVFREIDLMNEPKVLDLIEDKNRIIDEKISELINEWAQLPTNKSSVSVKKLEMLKNEKYDVKLKEYNELKLAAKNVLEALSNCKSSIDKLIKELKYSTYSTLQPHQIDSSIKDLKEARMLPLEEMQNKYHSIQSAISRVNNSNLEGIKTQINKTIQNQKDERNKLFKKIDNWTAGENKIVRRIVNSIVTLTIYITLYLNYDAKIAFFSSILYNTLFVLYSNFRIYSQNQRIIKIGSELKKHGADYMSPSPFSNLNFISLIFWLLFFYMGINVLIYGKVLPPQLFN